jgi:hypothetical protein
VHRPDLGAVAELQDGGDEADHDRPEQLVPVVQGRLLDVADEEAEVEGRGEQDEEAEDDLLEVHSASSDTRDDGCPDPARARPGRQDRR